MINRQVFIALVAALLSVSGVSGQTGLRPGVAFGAARVYTGCCDASAAVALDGSLFVVANDEDNVLRVYDSERAGAPVQTFDLGGFLKVDPKEPESDLEGAAKLGELVYWISSHGRSRTGKERASRHRLFATRFTVSGDSVAVEPVGRPYDRLLSDILAEPRLRPFNLGEAAAKEPKADGALNIEALAATVDGHLLIGFRNPILRGRALVLPLLNPTEVTSGSRAKFGDPLLLDLDGLGIRSMAERDGRILIVAGAHNGKDRYRLYEWGGGNSQPIAISTLALPDFSPEGQVALENSRQLLIISDDGGTRINGVECKDLKDPGAKRFRGIPIAF